MVTVAFISKNFLFKELVSFNTNKMLRIEETAAVKCLNVSVEKKEKKRLFYNSQG